LILKATGANSTSIYQIILRRKNQLERPALKRDSRSGRKRHEDGNCQTHPTACVYLRAKDVATQQLELQGELVRKMVSIQEEILRKLE